MSKKYYKIRRIKGRKIYIAKQKSKLAEAYFKNKYIKGDGCKNSELFHEISEESIHSAAISVAKIRNILPKKEYVLKADIKKFFDSIDVNKILNEKLPLYFNEEAMEYIKKMFVENEFKTGSKFSNLFADIYIHDVLKEFKGMEYCRFVDDFLFFFDTKEEAEEHLEKFKQLLAKENLTLNDKTMINHRTSKRNGYLGLKFYYDDIGKTVRFSVNKTTQKRIERRYKKFYDIISKNIDNIEVIEDVLTKMNTSTLFLLDYYRQLRINVKRSFYFVNKIIIDIGDIIGFCKQTKKSYLYKGSYFCLENNLAFYEGNTGEIILIR